MRTFLRKMYVVWQRRRTIAIMHKKWSSEASPLDEFSCTKLESRVVGNIAYVHLTQR